MWGGCRPSSALGVLPGLDAQPSPWGALGQQRTRAFEGIYSRENSGSLGETVYCLQAPEALVGSAVRAGAPPGRGLGGWQGPWGRRADAGSCGF